MVSLGISCAFLMSMVHLLQQETLRKFLVYIYFSSTITSLGSLLNKKEILGITNTFQGQKKKKKIFDTHDTNNPWFMLEERKA